MAKKKNKKIEKETYRLIESISDIVKKKGDRYKFKSKNKKTVKKIKKTCVHFIIRKGKEVPTVTVDGTDHWRCTICQKTFPIVPKKESEYIKATEEMLELVNQIQFYAVKLGGDAEDTKMFLKLKTDLPRFEKVAKHVLKAVNQRQAWEKNRENSDIMSQFNMYSGFNYKA